MSETSPVIKAAVMILTQIHFWGHVLPVKRRVDVVCT